MAKKESADFKLTDIYKEYVKETPEDIRVPYSVFSAVVKGFGNKLYDRLLYRADEIALPSIGTLKVRKNKMHYDRFNPEHSDKKSYIKLDWAATKKEGKKIYELNEHRDGHNYRFKWTKRRVIGIGPYKFRPIRKRKRELAFILKNRPDLDYFF